MRSALAGAGWEASDRVETERLVLRLGSEERRRCGSREFRDGSSLTIPGLARGALASLTLLGVLTACAALRRSSLTRGAPEPLRGQPGASILEVAGEQADPDVYLVLPTVTVSWSYAKKHSWKEGKASGCSNLGCRNLADGSPASATACQRSCDAEVDCDVVNFLPDGAAGKHVAGRCCLRHCGAGADLNLTTRWQGWDVYVIQEDEPSTSADGQHASSNRASSTASETTQTTTSSFDPLSTATTTNTVFFSHAPVADYPEIMYLSVPESKTDEKRIERMKSEVIRYLPEKRWGVRIIPGVVPELWPKGRYDRVEKYCRMLPVKAPKRKPRRAPARKFKDECDWTYKDDGGLYNHFYEAANGSRTLEACREECCRDERCNAIRYSPGAEDGPDLQCLFYPRGEVAWSLDLALHKDYRVHLLDRGCGEGGCDAPAAEPAPAEDDAEGSGKLWWQLRNLDMARITDAGEHPKDERAWPAHHCGCSLSHLTMWLEALHRGVQNLIIFESDGYPSCLESHLVGGNASDFDSLVYALQSQAPKDWDLIQLDKGRAGVEPDAEPVSQIRLDDRGGRKYDLLPWKGRGMAGAAAYMVSRRFLEWFPGDIKKYSFNMVDAWIGCRCSNKSTVNPSPINCYSVIREGYVQPK